jgi:hypothetical protein
VIVAVAALASCATAGTGTTDDPGDPSSDGSARSSGPVDATTFERRVRAFQVLDEAGEPFPEPFLGGFNLPRPQLVDIDGDGDDDLFVQEESGEVMFFERVQDGESAFRWRTDAYQELNVGEWYRFVDLDRDGDPDLLAEEP